MFGSLENALKPNWYNNPSNLKITFNIKNNSYTWEIFSIYTIEKTSDYLYTNFDSNKQFIEFINNIKTRSIKNFGIAVNKEDKILTLSTCYRDSKSRMVVHVKMI